MALAQVVCKLQVTPISRSIVTETSQLIICMSVDYIFDSSNDNVWLADLSTVK